MVACFTLEMYNLTRSKQDWQVAFTGIDSGDGNDD